MNEVAVAACSEYAARGGTVVRRPAALMVHKSVWPGWSGAAPARPSHAENESGHFLRRASVGAVLPASR